MYEELNIFIKSNFGWSLNAEELFKIHQKYFEQESKSVNYDRLLKDIQQNVTRKQYATYFDTISKGNQVLTFEEILASLRKTLLLRLERVKGENLLKKAYLLLGESRNPFLTKIQLNQSLQIRLSLTLSDADLQTIFSVLDPNNTGLISMREFVQVLLKDSANEQLNMCLPLSDSKPSTGTRSGTTVNTLPQAASPVKPTSIDSVVPPNELRCRYYSNEEIESCIFNRVSDSISVSSSVNASKLKLLMKLMVSDEQNGGASSRSISFNQMKYVLWKVLRLNITESNVQSFFMTYSQDVNQSVDVASFCSTLLDNQGNKQTKSNHLPQNRDFSSVVMNVKSLTSGRSVSVNEVEELIRIKCLERIKNSYPNASLYKLFRESDTETRFISKNRLQTALLQSFDLVFNQNDFDLFFEKHQNPSTHKIDIQLFLKKLIALPVIPVETNPHSESGRTEADFNPLIPKDSKVVKKEVLLAKVIEDMTGQRRSVNHLNGTGHYKKEESKPSLKQGYESFPDTDTTLADSSTRVILASSDPALPSSLEYADTLLRAMKDLPILASSLQDTDELSTTGASSSPLYSVKSLRLSPRRPSSAPLRSTPSYKTRQLTRGSEKDADATQFQRSIERPSSPSPVRSNVPFSGKSQMKSPPRSASHLPSRTSTPFEDEAYRKLQRENLLALAEAYGTGNLGISPLKYGRPLIIQYPHVMYDQQAHQYSGDADYSKQKLILEPQSNKVSLHKKKRPSSAPTRAQFYRNISAKIPTDPIDTTDRQKPRIVVCPAIYSPPSSASSPHRPLSPPTFRSPPPTSLSPASTDVPMIVSPISSPRSPKSVSSTMTTTHYITGNVHRINQNSEKWKRKEELSKKFVNTGRKYYLSINPLQNTLRDYYKRTEDNCVTTHEQYGIYMKSLKNANARRKQLYEKQTKLKINLHLHNPNKTDEKLEISSEKK
jgi:Ca2+-binding EF-hand superfamily protein